MTSIASPPERLRFPEALVIALLIHLLGLFLIAPVRRLFPAAADLQQVPPNPEPLRFTFVDLPEEVRVEENPDARFLSDADRLARSEVPPEEPGESDLPRSEGNSSMIEITPPGSEQALTKAAPEPPEPEPPAPENPPPGAPEPEPLEDRRDSPSAREPAPEIGTPVEPQLERNRETWQKRGVSRPQGYNTRFDNREDSRSMELGGLSFSTKNFDGGDYVRRIFEIIRSNWRLPLAYELGEKGICGFEFTIEREGTLSSIELVRTSGNPALDNAARLALEVSNPLPPFPKRFPTERETLTLYFYYGIPINYK